MSAPRSTLVVLALCSVFAQGQQQKHPLPVPKMDLTAIKGILVRRHPELAASPGYRYTSFNPGVGEPGCERTLESKAKDTMRWVGMPGSPEGKIEIPPPTCSKPVADIYFAPFRESGARSMGAYARCYAPVTDRTIPPPWNWTCDEVKFREYVHLEDQSCTVTLLGDLSDAQIRRFKEVGLSDLAKDGHDASVPLVKVVVHPGGQAVAMFGDGNCRFGNSIPTVFFLADRESEPEAPTKWKVVDADQWIESVGR